MAGAPVTVCRLRELQWSPMVLSGVALTGFHWCEFPSDEAGGWKAYWMQVSPGAKSEFHIHPATELVHVREGSLVDESGRRYESGDVAVFAAGSGHSTHSPSGCLALVVTGRHATMLGETGRVAR